MTQDNYNTPIFDKIIFLKFNTRQIKATALACLILEKDNLKRRHHQRCSFVCRVLYLGEIILSNICILYCTVLLNGVLNNNNNNINNNDIK